MSCVHRVTVSMVYVVGCSSVQAGLISLLCTMDINYPNTCVTLQSQSFSDKLVWINEQPLRLWYTLKCLDMTNLKNLLLNKQRWINSTIEDMRTVNNLLNT